MRTLDNTWKRRPVLLVGTAIALTGTLALAGCGGGSVADSGKTTITVWQGYAGDASKGLDKLVADFNASQDEYEVELQFSGPGDQLTPKLINAVKNNTAPDMMFGHDNPQGLGQIIETGGVVPLEDLLDSSDSTLSKDDFAPGILSTGVFDGTLYSLSTGAGNFAVTYNKKMFEEAGITDVPTTWAELEAAAKKLTKGTTQYGMYLPIGSGEWPVYTWQAMLWGAGGEFLNADNSEALFNSSEGVEALSAWTRMIEDGTAYPQSLQSGSDNQGTGAMTSGKTAMMINGPFNLGVLDEALGDDNVGVFSLPGISQPGMNIGTDAAFILKSTDEETQGAWEFMQYAFSPEVQAEWVMTAGFLPSNLKAQETAVWKEHIEGNPRLEVFAKQLEYAKARPSIQQYSQISAALSTELERALLGDVTPKEALDAAAAKANDLLAK